MPPQPTQLIEGLGRGVAYRTAYARASRRAARIARGDRPIVVGPWLSEVGVELLFWIPFLHWFRAEYGVGRERVIAISRGGAEPWYSDIASRYVDVFDHFGVNEVKRWTDERLNATNTQKQTEVGEADRRILRAAREVIGTDDYELLHPSLMHQMFRTFWNWRTGENRLSTVLSRTSFEPLAAPEPLGGLPSSYVAVKAYFNNCFPDDEANRAFLRRTLGRLRERSEVVLLATGLELDDHADFAASAGVHTLADRMTPRNNLELQTRAIAGADALFATLGGFSYLAAFLNVPSFSFSSDDERFVLTHRDLMLRAGLQLAGRGARAPFAAFPATSEGVLEGLGAGSSDRA